MLVFITDWDISIFITCLRFLFVINHITQASVENRLPYCLDMYTEDYSNVFDLLPGVVPS